MSDRKHWLEKLTEDDPRFKDYGFKELRPGFLEELGEACENEGLSDDELVESVRAGEIKRDSDLTVN